MAGPIVNDWKAIHDRMQQIQAERSPSLGRCRRCSGSGWIPNPFAISDRAVVCDLCHNPKGLSRPRTISRM
jgi:hypothetical protein